MLNGLFRVILKVVLFEYFFYFLLRIKKSYINSFRLLDMGFDNSGNPQTSMNSFSFLDKGFDNSENPSKLQLIHSDF
jgi:hypothetical protein